MIVLGREMLEVSRVFLALLATEDDKNEIFQIIIGIIAAFMQSQQIKR
jgi:hypothetical protein